MAKDRHTRELKRKKKLELRSRKARESQSMAYTGRKYKTEELVQTLMKAEVGIYESYIVTDRQLLDETAVTALERLIREIRVGPMPVFERIPEIDYEVGREDELIIANIRGNWALHFASHLQPSRDNLIGVLRTILGSIDTMRSAGRSQRYMRHIEEFLTKQIGISVAKVSPNMKPVPKLESSID